PPPDVVIDAKPVARDTRLVQAGDSNHWRSLTVGANGPATFKQTGGSTRIDNDLTIARNKDSTGRVELSGGTMSTGGNQYVGKGGKGEFVQSGGANVIDGSLFVGYAGRGSYTITRGTLTGDKIVVATTGDGNFTQGLDAAERANLAASGAIDGLAVAVRSNFNAVTVADKQGSHGEVVLNFGDFSSPSQTVGRAGAGSVLQEGGTNTATTLWLGTTYQSIGSYVLNDGVLKLDPSATIDGDPGITVGGAGSGSFRMGNANRAAKIIESQAGTNLAVRAKESGSGLFRGWGSVGLTGLVVNNGRIVADGYGNDRALDLSTAKGVTNTIENPIVAGANGWYARDGGAVVLPSVNVIPGSNAYSWGEDPNDALPDLVNSVRLYVRDAETPGEIDISLLSLDRTDIPALPSGHHFIGVWRFDAHDLDFTGVDLAIRYDDAMAQDQGLSEAILKLWKYENGDWVRINDDSFRRYTALNVLSGYAGPDLTYFAVSAPEPTSLGGLILGGWMLLRRRR
ncbi:MAG: PEP-CTERM sorting domain-containing protein, partial [Tepidisphaeraceae bacterium]